MCGNAWVRCTVLGGVAWYTYECGYKIGVDRNVVRVGRKSMTLVRAVSVFHPGPIPDENEDII